MAVLKLRLLVSCRILSLVQHFRPREMSRKNNLWRLGALLLSVPVLTNLSITTALGKVNSQVAPQVVATAQGSSRDSGNPLTGLFSRSSAIVAQASTAWPAISLTSYVSGLRQPVSITSARDGSGRLFVVEQSGRIRIIRNRTLLSQPFLDISNRVSCCGERGLLGVAFPPNYASRRHFYVYYTNPSGNIVVARYNVSSNPNVANSNSQQVILTINHPRFRNHNGGQLAFGPDGYLYIGTGDGGGSGDPQNNGQNRNSLLGKILRLNVESGTRPYAIPPSNPFRQTAGYRPEIWALGLRNPWRFSFDRQTGDLYIGDVGQDEYEEIDFQPASSRGGVNYGWRIMEGSQCYNTTTCNRRGLTLPVFEYDHDQGRSVTGGVVYRGQRYSNMRGIYFFADFISGRVWGLRRSGTTWQNRVLLNSPNSISAFGEDEGGNLYAADYRNGTLYQITSQ